MITAPVPPRAVASATAARVCPLLAAVLLATTLVPVTADQGPRLSRIATVVTSPIHTALPWEPDAILAVTGHDLRRVDWSAPAGPERETALWDLPAAPLGAEAWGDSLLVRFAAGPSWLLPRDGGGLLAPQEKPGNWRLPNARLDGQSLRVEIDPAFQLLVLTAPGPGQVVGLLDFADVSGPGELGRFAAERAVLATGDGVWVIDLGNPQLPSFQALIEPPVAGWQASDLDLRGQTLFIHWPGRIQSWDLADPAAPLLQDEIPVATTAVRAGERWLASWDPLQRGVTVIDAADPAAMTLRASVDVLTADVQVHRDVLLVGAGGQRLGFRIPAGQGAPVALGPAVQLLGSDLLAGDGQVAWLQDGRVRHVVASGTGAVLARQAPALPVGGGRDRFHRLPGHLLHLRAGEGLDVLDLADPADPQRVLTLALDPAPLASDRDGARLAVADGQTLALYDLADPAAPQRRGEVALAGTPQAAHLRGDVAVLLTGDVLAGEDGRVHVVDCADPDQPQLLTTLDAAPGGETEPWQAALGSWHGPDLRVLVWRQGLVGPVHRTLTVGLADPASPTVDFTDQDAGQWCFGSDPDTGDPLIQASDAPQALADLHVSFAADTVAVFRDPGGVADLERLAWWVAPDPVEELTVVGNRLLVQSGHRLDVLTYSDDTAVGVPALAAAGTVRAAPNPFNPRTTLRFAMPAAGRANVTVHDARGRRVRTLTAQLPAGPARVRWDGTAGDGRVLPSGTYLVRVVTPGGVQTGRCQLVR